VFAFLHITMPATAIAIIAASCFRARTTAEPAATSLTVHNHSSFDVDVFTIPSSMARPTRLGTVASNSTATFSLYPRDLQPGGFLSVEVHAIGARGSWVSDVVAVSSEELAVLDVDADLFGDCSASVLYTVWKSATATAA